MTGAGRGIEWPSVHWTRLRLAVRAIAATGFAFGIAQIAAWMVWHDEAIARSGIVSLLVVTWLVVVPLRLAQPGSEVRAVWALFVGLAAVGVGITFVFPEGLPVLAVTPLLAVAVGQSFVDRRTLLRLIEVGAFASLLIAILGQFSPNHSTLPPMVLAAFRIAGLTAASALTMGLLWQFSARLGKALEDAGQENADLQVHVDELEDVAVHDGLTGLYNRGYLEATLEREMLRAHREHSSLALIMADLDHLKAFNDRYGHQVGDDVLRAVGAFLAASVRGGDVACRYGGEEFAVILPSASLKDAVRRAEEICSGAATLHIGDDAPSARLPPVTMSLGAAAMPLHGSTPAELIKAADTALYAAKAQGRDRVVAAEVPAKAQREHRVRRHFLAQRPDSASTGIET